MLALYRVMLHLYPAPYRCEFGDEMMGVLLEVQAENQRKGAFAMLASGVHESGGLFYGAMREHFYSITGSYDNGTFSFKRRFAMRSEFRFPKATVGLMTIILGAVMFTIEKARDISMSVPHANPQVGPIRPEQFAIVQVLVAILIWAIASGAIGWGILYALRRSGIQQLSEMNPAAGQRSGK